MNKNKVTKKEIKLGGSTLTLETGSIAYQATGAVLATLGETVVMATVVASPMRQDLGYFPLSVEYQEKLYAGGRIKGSRWVKREGRPSDDEILTARLVDRSIRPLFYDGYKKDVQVALVVLSVDGENSPDIVAGIAASAAIEASEIPWMGPVGIVRVGRVDGKFVLNTPASEEENSDMDLIVSGTKDAIVMLEAGANEVTEEEVLEAIDFGQKENSKLVKFIQEFAKETGIKKEAAPKVSFSKTLEKQIKDKYGKEIKDMIGKMATKEAGYTEYGELKNAISESVDEKEAKEAGKIYEKIFEAETKKMLLSGKRPDGRKPDELRELSSMVDVLPRTHGSAIFQRGLTQVLTIATLGAPSLELMIETAEGEETKRYLHHYSHPPYSVGETGRMGWPGRREIGHGALAERALMPVIPSQDDFPYTIRLVSEVLSSNGSTSMASTCGSTLALMDAGVPIKAPVSGIAMGLVVEDEKNFKVLTDIAGVEDGNGDMDFKVAGTKDGVTAIQMDVKTLKLTSKILKDALAQAKDARMKILDNMLGAIAEPKKELSEHAPKIKVIKIDPSKIGELIGPGGKTIKGLIADTGADIDVEDDGSVFVSATDKDAMESAISRIEAITKDPVPGEIYDGEVKRLQSFGAFVEILPGKDGLVHVSDMSEDFVKNPEDVVSIGDKVQVRVKEIDDLGRINLSMILDPSKEKKGGSRGSSGGDRGGRSYSGGGGRGRDNRGGGRSHGGDRRGGGHGGNRRNDRRSSGGQSSGPHFPTSRLMDEE